MRAWIYQAYAHKQRDGDNAGWSVGWYEPDGTRKGKLLGAQDGAGLPRQDHRPARGGRL